MENDCKQEIINTLKNSITSDVIKKNGYWVDETTFYCAINIDRALFDKLNSLDEINCFIEEYDDSEHIAIEYWADDKDNKVTYELASDTDCCNITKLLKQDFDCTIMNCINDNHKKAKNKVNIERY